MENKKTQKKTSDTYHSIFKRIANILGAVDLLDDGVQLFFNAQLVAVGVGEIALAALAQADDFLGQLHAAVAALALTALLSSCGGGLPDYDYQIDMKPYKNAVTASGKTYLTLCADGKEAFSGDDRAVPFTAEEVYPDELFGEDTEDTCILAIPDGYFEGGSAPDTPASL